MFNELEIEWMITMTDTWDSNSVPVNCGAFELEILQWVVCYHALEDRVSQKQGDLHETKH